MVALAERSPEVVDGLTRLVEELASLPTANDDAERIARITALDAIKAAAAAAQAREISDFERSQLAEQRARGVPFRQQGRGIAEQIALARKVSPATGAGQLTFATALVRQLPATKALLAKGEISEWVAQIVARETAALAAADRAAVDAALAPELARMSPRQAGSPPVSNPSSAIRSRPSVAAARLGRIDA
ncbi:MAG TPA: DUF222 domain-containing protein [Nocardioidaceae bacterium]|nr:DUF222 domain-containing protein [Nocardioidaceae bacterium]